MEFIAVAKQGVFIYDAYALMHPRGAGEEEPPEDAISYNGRGPTYSMPPTSGPAGFAWGRQGARLATVDTSAESSPAIVWDANDGYSRMFEVPAIGNSGGVRALLFSPRGDFLAIHEKFDKDKCPQNVHIWDLRGAKVELVRSNALRGYSSGKIPVELYQWTPDDALALELAPGEGVRVYEDLRGEPKIVLPEPGCMQFRIAPASVKDGAPYVACYVPESNGKAGHVSIYHLGDASAPTAKQVLPTKLNGVTFSWNVDGSALLALAGSDVDPTGKSYFGTSSLFWISADGRGQVKVSGPEEGLVQDVKWSPKGDEFLMVIGMMPATISMYDGKTGKKKKDLTTASRRNSITWAPHSRSLVVGGFGALPGDVDFFDNNLGETICSFRAALTVFDYFAPDSLHWLACTTAPRMNEDNGISIYRYTGERMIHLRFVPGKAGAMRRDGGAVTRDGAMLYASGWRPVLTDAFEDKALTPRKGKAVKGLPAEGLAGAAQGGGSSARPAARGGGGGSIQDMMKGLVSVDAGEQRGWGDGGGAAAAARPPAEPEKQLTWEELQAEKKARKDAEKKRKQEDEEAARKEKEDLYASRKKVEGSEKKLEKLKKQLAELDGLKDKEWDELTEEDDAKLDGEIELRKEIAELEKLLGS